MFSLLPTREAAPCSKCHTAEAFNTVQKRRGAIAVHRMGCLVRHGRRERRKLTRARVSGDTKGSIPVPRWNAGPCSSFGQRPLPRARRSQLDVDLDGTRRLEAPGSLDEAPTLRRASAPPLVLFRSPPYGLSPLAVSLETGPEVVAVGWSARAVWQYRLSRGERLPVFSGYPGVSRVPSSCV